MSGQTLQEKYYAINAALNRYLKSYSVRCPVYKYGIDPATLKNDAKDQTVSRYPYMQTYVNNVRPQSWTKDSGGIYTRFEFQLSFFTSPENELENDMELFKPFDVARMAFSDIEAGALIRLDDGAASGVTIADLLSIREERDFRMVSGAPVPKAVLIAELAAVCGYPVHTPDPGISTDLDNAVSISGE